MKIIDFHTHIYPDDIARKATDSICNFYGLHTDLVGTVNLLLSEGKAAGIERFVLLPVAIRPSLVHSVNDFTSHQVLQHREFIGFGTLHAAMAHPLDELERFMVLGLKGLKLHPDTQGFNADDERLFPVYDALQERYPVIIHCGDRKLDSSHPERIKRILKLFPRLTVIAAHFGGWSMFEQARKILRSERCYFDMSSCSGLMSREQLCEYIRAYGAHRVLFGTDFPLWNPSQEVKTLLNLPLTDDELEHVAYKNAEQLLNMYI